MIARLAALLLAAAILSPPAAALEDPPRELDRAFWRPEAARALPAPADPYLTTLRDGFADLAARELRTVDFRDARRFLARARAAAAGAPQPPEDPDSRDLTEDRRAVFALRRAELLALIASPGARARAPVEIAALHLAFDDWLEATEHDIPPGRASAAEAAYLAQRDVTLPAAAFPLNVVIVMPPEQGDVGGVAVGGAALDTPFAAVAVEDDGRVRPTVVLPDEVADVFAGALAAEPIPPAVFTLYFERGRSRLDDAAQAVIDAILADIRGRPAATVAIEGHASPLGDAADNRALSARRAVRVRDAIRTGPVDNARFSVAALGQRERVSTGPEEFALDRRVVVTVR